MRSFGNRRLVTARAAVAIAAVAVASLGPVSPASAATARERYAAAAAREKTLRAAPSPVTLNDIRAAAVLYERVVREHPRSGYSDNALWQASGLARLAYERFGQERDREKAMALLKQLRAQYPSSSLAAGIDGALRALEPQRPAPASAPPPAATATLLSIQRTPLPDGVRIMLEFDREVLYTDVRLDGPPRLFFDFRGVQAAAGVSGSLQGPDDPARPLQIVREIRLGRHPDATTRVVMPLEGVARYSTFALYDPYRLVIDFVREADDQRPPPRSQVKELPRAEPVRAEPPATPGPPPSLPPAPPQAPPALPATNTIGGFSLARQLGLGVARVVIDPGHGGHDPGAQANRLSESQLVLDVALRLERILVKRRLEVVLTRRTDAFVPLEERTAIANREQADLFLSIHANASQNAKAQGVETFFLNFASNPEAEAVAARENSSSGRTMRSLPDIVRAIALNNKLDESRDFAGLVQRAMIKRLKPQNRAVRDLGVKQAPFVVLIGAAMPSVLAEVSFLTNRTEGGLLRNGAYRQRIAEALADAIMQYQRALKKIASLAQH
jgi:N-acetylmuramoyl-L-alanine amidase